jgi:serine protease AprX
MMRPLLLFWVIFGFIQTELKGQFQKTSPNTYILFLKDKAHNTFDLNKPEAFLSSRAITRRQNQQLAIDSADLPVSRFYLDSLSSMGVNIHNVSRWFNSVTFKTTDNGLQDKLSSLSFVSNIEQSPVLKVLINRTEILTSVSDIDFDSASYGSSYKQIHFHNGDFLHHRGLRGEHMLIAVIDAGFENYQYMTGFESLRNEGRIKAIRDFVTHDGEVNSDHYHGANVLSIMAAQNENEYIGTAPFADYLLLRSEDATYNDQGIQNENLVEEDNWIAAAEFADSVGTDVITTSLGYTTFNDPARDHTYQDMNGTTTRISRAAEMASKKGMIVIVSAGNEGANEWKYISAPADAKDVLAVGAVNINGNRANFSSIGPSYDNRVKPDVMSIGQGTWLQTSNNEITTGSGTSYAAPVIAGLTACLWQGAQKKTYLEVLDAIRKSSDNYSTPDAYYGYGIPDFKKALLMLNPSLYNKYEEVAVYPNPFSNHFTIQYDPMEGNSLTIELFNATGQKIYHSEYSIIANTLGEIEIDNVSDIPRGFLILRITSGSRSFTKTLIKL